MERRKGKKSEGKLAEGSGTKSVTEKSDSVKKSKGKGKANDADASAARAAKKQRRIEKQAKAVMEDDRFAHIMSDKRFKPMPKVNNTVKIGKRFETMFTADEFSAGPAGTNELHRFYHTADEETAAKTGGPRAIDAGEAGAMEEDTAPDFPSRGSGTSGDVQFSVDYSRGEVLLESSSEEEDDDEEEEDGGVDVWLAGQPDQHERVETTDDVGRRLAVCNLDWTNINASDLFVLANSFKPETGTIETVTIYPSDFGLERMQEEASDGPGRLIREATGQTMDDAGHEGYDEEEAQQHLRAYELSKLRYYYAVIVCDSDATASVIYEQIDGLEFEKSQNILDVRCVPDDVAFDNEPKDHCGQLPSEIEFNLDAVQQSALAHSKVKLSWDEDDIEERLVLKKRKFTDDELERIDYSNYLASDDSSESEDDEDSHQKKQELFRGLVEECEEEEAAENPEDGELEITWAVGLKERTEALLAARDEREQEKHMTIGEKLEKKRRDKKRARKQKIKELLADRKGGHGENEEALEGRVGGEDPYFQQDLTAEFSDDDDDDESGGPIRESGAAASAAESHSDDGSNRDEDEISTVVLDDEDSRHFDMTKIIKEHRKAGKKGKSKRKGKKGTQADEDAEDTFALDTKDGRFGAVFTDKDFSIDPTRPEFKKTREMERLISERQSKVSARQPRKAAGKGSERSDELVDLVEKIRASHPQKIRAGKAAI